MDESRSIEVLQAAPATDGATLVFHAALLLPPQQGPSRFDLLEQPARQWAGAGWRIAVSGPRLAYHFGAGLVGAVLA